MSLNIIPLSAFDDNYIWLLIQNDEVVCIDPGQAEQVEAFIQERQLKLKSIFLTHHHADHTAGVAQLKKHYPECRVIAYADIDNADEYVMDGNTWVWGECQIHVRHCAGHTEGHLVYHVQHQNQHHLFVGDTLFSAGCGRVFPNSRPEWLFESIEWINQFPENSLIYPAHEYTAANLRFAAHIEPNNSAIVQTMKQLSIPSLPVTLAHERQINPFLRTRHSDVIQNVCALTEQSINDAQSVFIALRELKNNF